MLRRIPALTITSLLLCASSPAWAGIDVKVRGLGSDERDNSYAQLSILEYAKRTDAEKTRYDEADVQRLFKQGAAEIKTALQPFGWYSVTVTSELKGSAPNWTAIYTVDAGPETDVAKVEIQIAGDGKDYAPLLRLVKRHRPLRIGRRLKHEQYETLKAHLIQTAYAGGMLDATLVRHELRVDVPNHSAEVLLTIDTGQRYRYGEISIEQDGHLHDSLLRRYVTFHTGEYYDPAEVLSTQFALGDLDYFQTVDIDTQRDKVDAEGRIPMVIRTVEKAPRVYKYGLGYGTDTGPRASVGVEFRRLNNSGHKLNLDLRISPKISTAIAEYRIPVGHVPSDSISFTTQALTQNFSDVNETLYRFGTSYNRQGRLWQRRLYLEYTVDDFTIRDSPRRTSKLLVPGVSFTGTVADDPIFPKHGWYAFADVHGGSSTVFSDTNFIQGLIKLRSTLYLGKRFYLLSRISEGATWVGTFNNLPPSQRFFAGGDESVRGYAYQQLGPRDANGRVIGGKYLTTASSEIDWYFNRSYGVAVFGDAGGADDDPLVRLSLGAGAGLRYRAPFGSFALDLAHPFDRDQSPVRLHIGVRVGL